MKGYNVFTVARFTIVICLFKLSSGLSWTKWRFHSHFVSPGVCRSGLQRSVRVCPEGQPQRDDKRLSITLWRPQSTGPTGRSRGRSLIYHPGQRIIVRSLASSTLGGGPINDDLCAQNNGKHVGIIPLDATVSPEHSKIWPIPRDLLAFYHTAGSAIEYLDLNPKPRCRAVSQVPEKQCPVQSTITGILAERALNTVQHNGLQHFSCLQSAIEYSTAGPCVFRATSRTKQL